MLFERFILASTQSYQICQLVTYIKVKYFSHSDCRGGYDMRKCVYLAYVKNETNEQQNSVTK